jgi:hypothetical protein
MKELSQKDMEAIHGSGFWDGFCQGAGAAAVVVSAAASGVGLIISSAVVAGCFTYYVVNS